MPAAILLPLLLASSLVPGLVIFTLPERAHRTRTLLNLAGALAKLALVGLLLAAVADGGRPEVSVPFLPGGVDLVLRADALALLFVTLSSLLWLAVTIYAIGYLEGSPHRSRFFGFFSICVSATVGVALAGNLVTLLVCYEILTVATYPLVVHRGTEKAIAAGRWYLAYTVGGGAVLLLAVSWLTAVAGPQGFERGGYVAAAGANPQVLRIVFALFVVGFGVKAVLVPLHGWLPRAMVAPAPVSALLHAVAVVKVGAFGIVRLVYDVYGVEFSRGLGVLGPLAIVAALTVLHGSVKALGQEDIKKRLAYSTISQIALIILGTALATPLALLGGLVHLVHHALLKVTLFLCAGNLAETLGIHRVSHLDGVGRRMPATMVAFTVAALGMIGVPATAGFVTKWYLVGGAAESGNWWVLVLLGASSLLNAGYFLPLVYRAWFRSGVPPWPSDARPGRLDAKPTLLIPTLATAAVALIAGLAAGTAWSPLRWAARVAGVEWVVP